MFDKSRLQKAHVPRKAVAEIAPFLMETIIVIPVSRNGVEKSRAMALWWLILIDVITMSAFPSTTSLIKPFHSPVTYIMQERKRNTKFTLVNLNVSYDVENFIKFFICTFQWAMILFVY